jgi:serine/threonine protein kinase
MKMATAELEGKPVMIKFFIESKPIDDECIKQNQKFDRYLYESAMYETITEHKFNHFVKLIDYGVINVDDPQFLSSHVPVMRVLRRRTGGCKAKRVHFMVTEIKEKSDTVHKLFDEFNDEEMRSMIFQVIYNLHRMEKMGWQHNDLHTGNILVDRGYPDEIEIYVIEEKIYNIPLHKNNVLFFDWDYGYIEGNPNKFIDEHVCESFGICSNVNAKFDLYIFLAHLYDRLIYYKRRNIENKGWSDLNTFIIRVLGEKKFPGERAHRICDLKDGKCSPFPKGEPQSIMSPLEALQDPYFDEFLI